MKRFGSITLVLLLSLFIANPTSSTATMISSEIEVFFSPNDHVTDKIVSKIHDSKKSILVLAYSFTSKRISDALIAAHKHGVDVQIIIDGGQMNPDKTEADDCQQAGIPVFMDTKYRIAHDKVMIFDDQCVLTGSFNFTNAAEYSNSENVVFIQNPTAAMVFKDRWDQRKLTSVNYQTH